MELVVLKIPADVLCLKLGDVSGLLTRVDKTDLIDLNINTVIFIDRKSGVDFSTFIHSVCQAR